MIISREYNIDPKTAVENRVQDEIKLGDGTLVKVSVQSAPGVNGEVYFRLMHFESSIVPDETDQWITLTGTRQEYNMEFSDWHKVPVVIVEICAPDARFSHRINVELETIEDKTLTQLFTDFIKGGLRWPNP